MKGRRQLSIHHVRDGRVISQDPTGRAGGPIWRCAAASVAGRAAGSRSYDVMSAIGPSPLRAGDVLPDRQTRDDYPELDQAPVAAIRGASGWSCGWCPGRPTTGWVDPDALVHTILDSVNRRQPRRNAATRAARYSTAGRIGNPAGVTAAQSRCRPTVTGDLGRIAITGSYRSSASSPTGTSTKSRRYSPANMCDCTGHDPGLSLPGRGVTQAW